MSNYKSFGDTKIVPDVGEDAFLAVLKASKADEGLIDRLWPRCRRLIFSLEGKVREAC